MTQTRISKHVKAIADAHIAARLNGTFDDIKVTTKDEIISALNEGKTFSKLLDEIEFRFLPIITILLSKTMYHQSATYKKGVYKGFKILLQG